MMHHKVAAFAKSLRIFCPADASIRQPVVLTVTPPAHVHVEPAALKRSEVQGYDCQTQQQFDVRAVNSSGCLRSSAPWKTRSHDTDLLSYWLLEHKEIHHEHKVYHLTPTHTCADTGELA